MGARPGGRASHRQDDGDGVVPGGVEAELRRGVHHEEELGKALDAVDVFGVERDGAVELAHLLDAAELVDVGLGVPESGAEVSHAESLVEGEHSRGVGQAAQDDGDGVVPGVLQILQRLLRLGRLTPRLAADRLVLDHLPLLAHPDAAVCVPGPGRLGGERAREREEDARRPAVHEFMRLQLFDSTLTKLLS